MKKLINYIKEHQVEALIMVLAFAFIFLQSIRTQTDYDYWFHYRAGEYFIKNLKVPSTPIGSWWASAEGLPWISHEWAFGVFIYLLSNLIGEGGLIIFSTMMVSLAGALVFGFRIKDWKEHPVLAVAGIIILSEILKAYAVPRPQLFLYLFTICLFALLLHERDKQDNKIWWLAPLTVLWTNFHGGSYILIFVFLFVLIVTDSFDLSLGKIEFKKVPMEVTKKRLRVFIVSFILVAFNGHGLDMYYYPLSNWTDTVMIENISEWQSANIKNTLDLWSMIMPCLFLCALIGTKKKVKGFDMIVGWAMIYLSLQSIRFFAQTNLFLMMVIPGYFDSLEKFMFPLKEYRLKYTLMLCVLFTAVGSAGATINAYTKPFNMGVFPSEELIQKIKEIQPERLYNTYDTGGYLVYRHVDVFIDGRADIYSRYNMSDYVKMSNYSFSTDDLMTKYNFDYLLIKKDTRLQQYIQYKNASIENYELLFEDDNFKLYKNLNYIESVENIEVEGPVAESSTR